MKNPDKIDYYAAKLIYHIYLIPFKISNMFGGDNQPELTPKDFMYNADGVKVEKYEKSLEPVDPAMVDKKNLPDHVKIKMAKSKAAWATVLGTCVGKKTPKGVKKEIQNATRRKNIRKKGKK